MKRWVNNVNPLLSLHQNHQFLVGFFLLKQLLLLNSQYCQALEHRSSEHSLQTFSVHFLPIYL